MDLNLPETREELLQGEPTRLYDIVAEFFTQLENKYGADVLYDVKDTIDEFFDYDGPTGVNRMADEGNLSDDEYANAFTDTLLKNNNKTSELEFTDPDDNLEDDEEEDGPYFN